MTDNIIPFTGKEKIKGEVTIELPEPTEQLLTPMVVPSIVEEDGAKVLEDLYEGRIKLDQVPVKYLDDEVVYIMFQKDVANIDLLHYKVGLGVEWIDKLIREDIRYFHLLRKDMIDLWRSRHPVRYWYIRFRRSICPISDCYHRLVSR